MKNITSLSILELISYHMTTLQFQEIGSCGNRESQRKVLYTRQVLITEAVISYGCSGCGRGK